MDKEKMNYTCAHSTSEVPKYFLNLAAAIWIEGMKDFSETFITEEKYRG